MVAVCLIAWVVEGVLGGVRSSSVIGDRKTEDGGLRSERVDGRKESRKS